MTEEEIKEVEEEGIEVFEDEFGNIINMSTNNELNTMGKGDDEPNGNE